MEFWELCSRQNQGISWILWGTLWDIIYYKWVTSQGSTSMDFTPCFTHIHYSRWWSSSEVCYNIAWTLFHSMANFRGNQSVDSFIFLSWKWHKQPWNWLQIRSYWNTEKSWGNKSWNFTLGPGWDPRLKLFLLALLGQAYLSTCTLYGPTHAVCLCPEWLVLEEMPRLCFHRPRPIYDLWSTFLFYLKCFPLGLYTQMQAVPQAKSSVHKANGAAPRLADLYLTWCIDGSKLQPPDIFVSIHMFTLHGCRPRSVLPPPNLVVFHTRSDGLSFLLGIMDVM